MTPKPGVPCCNGESTWSGEENRLLMSLWRQGLPAKKIAAAFPHRTARAVELQGYTGLQLGSLKRYRKGRRMLAWARIEAALRERAPQSSRELAEGTGMSRRSAMEVIALHRHLLIDVGTPRRALWRLGLSERDAA